jgi:nucleoside 2-deoxyribosyltransferase
MKIYLAIPYSFNPELSFKIANKVAAKLMSEGHTVYSPISHSHCIADYLPNDLRTNAKWWMKQDLPMIDWAEALYVICIGENGIHLIADSEGVQDEIERAKEQRKTIKIIDYE